MDIQIWQYGNVVGSNICNLLLILGLATVISAVDFKRETRIIEIPMCLTFTIVFTVLCNTGNTITRTEALILIALFILFILYTIIMAVKGESFDKEDRSDSINKEENEKDSFSTIKSIVYIILGIIGLKIGGDLAVDNAVSLAERFNISEQIISLTILAIGTSLPELVTSVTAAIKGNSDIAIGNILGSNIFNILLIIGVSAIIKPITYNIGYNVELGILLIAMIVLAVFPLIPPKNKMSRYDGIVYLLMYSFYMFILFYA